jgi:hypothetical protein
MELAESRVSMLLIPYFTTLHTGYAISKLIDGAVG